MNRYVRPAPLSIQEGPPEDLARELIRSRTLGDLSALHVALASHCVDPDCPCYRHGADDGRADPKHT